MCSNCVEIVLQYLDYIEIMLAMKSIARYLVLHPIFTENHSSLSSLSVRNSSFSDNSSASSVTSTSPTDLSPASFAWSFCFSNWSPLPAVHLTLILIQIMCCEDWVRFTHQDSGKQNADSRDNIYHRCSKYQFLNQLHSHI